MSERMTIVGAAAVAWAPEAPDAVAGVLLHKFVKADSWRGALTPDPSGANLPTHGSAWIYAKEVLVSPSDRRVGATSLQITNGVSERGYFLFPISDDA
jgi:hypothetical protein